jgi:hypothetical protein
MSIPFVKLVINLPDLAGKIEAILVRIKEMLMK